MRDCIPARPSQKFLDPPMLMIIRHMALAPMKVLNYELILIKKNISTATFISHKSHIHVSRSLWGVNGICYNCAKWLLIVYIIGEHCRWGVKILLTLAKIEGIHKTHYTGNVVWVWIRQYPGRIDGAGITSRLGPPCIRTLLYNHRLITVSLRAVNLLISYNSHKGQQKRL